MAITTARLPKTGRLFRQGLRRVALAAALAALGGCAGLGSFADLGAKRGETPYGAYLAGRLAAKMSRSGQVGIVVSGEPPSWNSQSAGFAEGVKAENPEVKVTYAVIGPAAYSDAAGGKRVTESLIASGADIIFGQGNGSSFGMLQAVETTKAADGGAVVVVRCTITARRRATQPRRRRRSGRAGRDLIEMEAPQQVAKVNPPP